MIPKNSKCPICGSKKIFIFSKTKSVFKKSRKLASCRNCDHSWVIPMPEKNELAKFYKKNQGYIDTSYLKAFKKNSIQIFKKILLFENYKRFKNILEVGPGPIGILPLLEKNQNYSAIEPNNLYTQNLYKIGNKKSINIEIIPSFNTIKKKPYLVFSNATFEHFITPSANFSKISKKICKGSKIILGVPDSEIENPCLKYFKIQKPKEIQWTKNHLHLFSEKSLILLFQKNNIKVLKKYHVFPGFIKKIISKVASELNDGLSNHKYSSVKWQGKVFLLSFFVKAALVLFQKNRNADDRGEIIIAGIKK